MPRPTGGYRLADNTRVSGVTTIIGRFKDANALMYWAYEQGMLAERGEISGLYDKRDDAAEAGTLAHQLVEAHIKGSKKPKIPQNDIGQQALQGFKNYKKWAKNNKIKIVEQEIELVSEKYRYGGCIDAIGIDANNRRCIIDWKTSSSVYVDHLIQISAYAKLWEENNPLEPISGGYHLIRFSRENADFAHHYWDNLDDAYEQFLLFLTAYENDKKLKKRAK